uniref:RH63320p n=1 Tax=Drosophila melanogaster TaxID=7227 RepID=Q7JRA6_DROME|nr:RH63320p [Drosophila melanogaster]
MKTRVGLKVSLLVGVWSSGGGGRQGQGGVVGGSHVCGKPCKQRFKMIKCFRSRSCVGRVLSFRPSGLSGLVFRALRRLAVWAEALDGRAKFHFLKTHSPPIYTYTHEYGHKDTFRLRLRQKWCNKI